MQVAKTLGRMRTPVREVFLYGIWHISLWFNEVWPYASLNQNEIWRIPYENASCTGNPHPPYCHTFQSSFWKAYIQTLVSDFAQFFQITSSPADQDSDHSHLTFPVPVLMSLAFLPRFQVIYEHFTQSLCKTNAMCQSLVRDFNNSF